MRVNAADADLLLAAVPVAKVHGVPMVAPRGVGPAVSRSGSLVSPVLEFAFDNVGRRTQSLDPLDNAATPAYADFGATVTVTQADPDGAGGPLAAPVTSSEFDEAGKGGRQAETGRVAGVDPRQQGLNDPDIGLAAEAAGEELRHGFLRRFAVLPGYGHVGHETDRAGR